jgi:hypothetical protein
MEKIWQITAPHFTAGIIVVGDTVADAAPILRWAIGKPWEKVREHCIAKSWHGQRCPAELSYSDIKRRGWTDSLIRKYLPLPDRTAPNPHHPNGRDMRLYAIWRVETAETSAEVQEQINKSIQRRSAA